MIVFRISHLIRTICQPCLGEQRKFCRGRFAGCEVESMKNGSPDLLRDGTPAIASEPASPI